MWEPRRRKQGTFTAFSTVLYLSCFHRKYFSITAGIKIPFESPQDTCEKCVVQVFLKLAEKPPTHFAIALVIVLCRARCHATQGSWLGGLLDQRKDYRSRSLHAYMAISLFVAWAAGSTCMPDVPGEFVDRGYFVTQLHLRSVKWMDFSIQYGCLYTVVMLSASVAAAFDP